MTAPAPEFILFVTLACIISAGYNYTESFSSEISSVKSKVDQRKYIVLNLPDRDTAADQLAHLRIKLTRFIDNMAQKKSSKLDRDGIHRLKTKFKAVISETKPGSKFTSYTVNKGTKIFMCIREKKDNNKLIDENTCFFVALHELAHVMTKSVGHTKEFWRNFRFLLKHAIKDGYYMYHPYHNAPKKYCGTYISDTPLKL
jgi:hypothetical protein